VRRQSEFYGIAIIMHWRDQLPTPYHAAYGDHEALIVTDEGCAYTGSLPRRGASLDDRVQRFASTTRVLTLEAFDERASRSRIRNVEGDHSTLRSTGEPDLAPTISRTGSNRCEREMMSSAGL
jgi:hypothetical protein